MPRLGLYFRGETVKFKWLLLCRRSEYERPKHETSYGTILPSERLGFYRNYSYLTLYLRFPWKVWCYSINKDGPEHEHPMWCFQFRWVVQTPLRGHPEMKPKHAHTA